MVRSNYGLHLRTFNNKIEEDEFDLERQIIINKTMLRLLVVLVCSAVVAQASLGRPSNNVIAHVLGTVRNQTEFPKIYNLVNRIEKDLFEKRKADDEANRLKALEKAIRESVGNTGATGSSATGSSATGGIMDATGATGGVTGATGSGATGSGATDDEASVAATGATATGATGGMTGQKGATGSVTGSATLASFNSPENPEEMSNKTDQILDTPNILENPQSPMNLTEKIWNNAEKIMKEEDRTLDELEKHMIQSVQECSRKFNQLQTDVTQVQRKLSTSAHHLLQLNMRSREPMLVLRDAYPILKEYANILASSKTSAKLEMLHLQRQDASVRHLLIVVDQLFELVGLEVPRESKGPVLTGGPHDELETTFVEMDNNLNLNLNKKQNQPSKTVASSIKSFGNNMSLDQLQKKKAALSNQLELARSHLIQMLTLDAYQIHTTTRKERAKARHTVATLTLAVETLTESMRKMLRKRDVMKSLKQAEDDMVGNGNMGRDVKNLRQRLLNALTTIEVSKASVSEKRRVLQKSVETYVSPIRLLMSKMPSMVEKEENKFLDSRSEHLQLRSQRDTQEAQSASLSKLCIAEFRHDLAQHAKMSKDLTKRNQGENAMMQRISKAQTLWEHVRRLSEMNQKRARSEVHAQEIIRAALQRTEDAMVSPIYSGPDEQLVMPSRTERTEMLTSKKKVEWVVSEGGASLSRAYTTVRDVSDAAKVVEQSIKSLDTKISNATRSVRRAIRKSGDISKRVNATREEFRTALATYNRVEQDWNVLDARRRVLIAPWDKQVNVDVSEIQARLDVLRSKAKKIKKQILLLNTKGTTLGMKIEKTETSMSHAVEDVGSASKSVDNTKEQLDTQWIASQSMSSFLQLQKTVSTPSEEDAEALEDQMLVENGQALETLKEELNMKRSNNGGDDHRFQKVDSDGAAQGQVKGKEDVVNEEDLNDKRDNLDEKQSNLEDIQTNHTQIKINMDAVNENATKAKEVLSNTTIEIERLEQSLAEERSRVLSARAREYKTIYNLFLKKSNYVNITQERNDQKKIASEAKEIYMLARRKLSNTTEMARGAKILYVNTLKDLFAMRTKLNKIKIQLYKREATVSSVLLFLFRFFPSLFFWSFFVFFCEM